MDSTGDTVTVGRAERQGKRNRLESDYFISTPDTVLSSLSFNLSYIRLPPVEEALLTLNDEGVTKQCMCSCQLSILLSQIEL